MPRAFNVINAHYNAAITSWVVDWCVNQQKAGAELCYGHRTPIEMQTDRNFGRVTTIAARLRINE